MKRIISILLSVLVIITSVIPIELTAYAQSYEEKLIEKGFPKSYAKALSELHTKYPKWIFEPVITGIDWQTAVNGERSGHSNQLIEYTSSTDSSVYCCCSKCLNNGKPIIREASNWVAASEKTVKYYMDPRNWLDEKHIFQFESVLYDGTQSKNGVEAILDCTWMHDSLIKYKTTSGADKTYNNTTKYSDAIMSAAKDSGMSAYYLAAKIRQENGGANPTATAVCGTSSPFQGMYNYYNIGAYSGARDGLEWAAGFIRTNKETTLYSEYDAEKKQAKGTTTKLANQQYMTWRANKGKYYYVRLYDVNTRKEGKSGYVLIDDVRTTYLGDTATGWGRPWSNPYKSIFHGASWIYKSFKTQYTGYFQKFNVSPSSSYLYSNEYMRNVSGAAVESVSTYNGYKNADILGITKKFYIPVFEHMPIILEDNPLEYVSNDYNTVTFKWTEVESAVGYDVEVFEDNKWKNVTTVKDTLVTVTGLENCKRFKFRVRYYTGSDKKREYLGYSLENTFATKPLKVENLTAEATTGTVKLSWTPVKHASGYYVYLYNTSLGKYKHIKTVADSKASSVKISVPNASTKYKFKVCAYKKAGGKKYKGTKSSAKSVKTKSGKVVLTGAVSKKTKKIKVTWEKLGGVSGYEVMWSTTSDFSSNFLSQTVSYKKDAKTITTYRSNTNYYVKVRAYKNIDGKKHYYKWSKKLKVKVK